MKRKVVVLLLIIIMIVSACSSKNSTAPSGTNTSTSNVDERPMDEIKVTAAQHPNGFLGLPFQVGIAKGFYEEEGIKITGILPASGGGTSVRNILEGDLAFGSVAPMAAIQAYMAGANLKIIAGSAAFADVVVVTRKDAPFEKPEDLIGHTWAYTNPGSASHALTYMAFEVLGIDPNSLTVVSTGGISEGLTLLRNGEIDACIVIEPLYQQVKDEFKLIYRVPDVLPGYPGNVLVTRSNLLKEDPDLVERFMRAFRKSIDYIYENPEEAAEIQVRDSEADIEHVTAAVKELVKAENWSAALTTQGLNYVMRGAVLSEAIEESTKIDWDDLIDQSFLPEEMRIDTKDLLYGE